MHAIIISTVQIWKLRVREVKWPCLRQIIESQDKPSSIWWHILNIMVSNKREGIVTRKEVHRERLRAEPIWCHMVFWKICKMCVKVENHLGLVTSQPQLLPLCVPPPVTCGPCWPRWHLLAVFRGFRQSHSPCKFSRKHCLCHRTQQLRPRKGVGCLLVSTQPQFPHVFSDLIFPPRGLATPAEKVSRTQSPGLCAGGGRYVLAELGQVRQKCMWLAWCVTKKGESLALQDLGQQHLCRG